MSLKIPEQGLDLPVTDLELLQRYRSGDTEAMGLFYRRYCRPLYLYACSLTRDPLRAEDVVQQAFVRLLELNPAAIGRVRGLLYVIARNLIRDDQRRESASRKHYPRLETNPPTDNGAPSIGADRLEALSRALQRLPEEQREVVILKIHGDLTFAEIAETAGVPEPTAKARYRYALEKLGALVEKEGREA
jgi:RNA polymerase sigma-70 factor (ECF subfamily)